MTSLLATLPVVLLLELGRALARSDLGAPDRMSVGALLAGLVSLVLVVGYRRGRTGRAGAVAALATLMLWLPFFALGAAAVSACPSTSSHAGLPWNRDLVGTGLIAAFVVALPSLACLTVIASSGRETRLDRALRASALASLAVVGAATLVGVVRVHRTDPDTYADSLPLTRMLALNESLSLADGTTLAYTRDTVLRVCNVSGLHAPNLWPGFSCEPLAFRYDGRSDLWNVIDTGSFSTCAASEPCGFHDKERSLWTHISAADVHETIAPPLAWTVSGAVGVVLGVALYLVARRHARARGMVSATEGSLEESGWASLPNGDRVKLSVAPVVPGPVLLDLREGTGSAYREAAAGQVRSWRRGTLRGVLEEGHGRAVALYALATAVCLLCGAPLVTWWMSWPQRLS